MKTKAISIAAKAPANACQVVRPTRQQTAYVPQLYSHHEGDVVFSGMQSLLRNTTSQIQLKGVRFAEQVKNQFCIPYIVIPVHRSAAEPASQSARTINLRNKNRTTICFCHTILEFGAAGKSLALYGRKIEINSTWTGV
jgi:hypothetical protein